MSQLLLRAFHSLIKFVEAKSIDTAAIAANINKEQIAWIGNSVNLRISIAGINNFMHIGRLHVRDSTTLL